MTGGPRLDGWSAVLAGMALFVVGRVLDFDVLEQVGIAVLAGGVIVLIVARLRRDRG